MGIHFRIKQERERIGLTQAGLADAINTTRRSVVNWETEAAQPPAVAVAAMSGCGMDVLYILTGQRSQPLASSPDEEMLMGAYRRATLAQKQAILGAAIGVAPPPQAVGNVSGGSVVQSAQGNGVVQIGKISNSKPRR